MAKIVIVGAGISGLTLAHRLEQLLPSAAVTVLEKLDRIGGTIGTVERDGFRVEIGPNGFLDNKTSTWELCKELGLESRLISASETARKNRFLLLRGRLRKLPTGLLSFLTTRVLGWRSKIALFMERFRRPRTNSSDESIDAFARRRLSHEIADTLVDAFVTGIHAGDPKLLSVRAALPRLAELERDYGSLTRGMRQSARKRRAEAKARGEAPRRGMRTWSFPEGMGVLVDTLRDKLKQAPVTGVSLTSVTRDGETGQWNLSDEQGREWTADALVLTCPAHAQASLLAETDRELAKAIDEIVYNRVAVVALGYRRADVPHSLDGFGYLSPGHDKRDVLGVQWCSSIFPERAPENHVLLRAMCGGWHRPEMVDWDEEQLLHVVREEMRHVLGVEREPVFHHVTRWTRAIPQYHLGHLERVQRIDERCARHAGLFLGGNCYRGIAMNDCVEQSNLLASRIAEHSNAQ